MFLQHDSSNNCSSSAGENCVMCAVASDITDISSSSRATCIQPRTVLTRKQWALTRPINANRTSQSFGLNSWKLAVSSTGAPIIDLWESGKMTVLCWLRQPRIGKPVASRVMPQPAVGTVMLCLITMATWLLWTCNFHQNHSFLICSSCWKILPKQNSWNQ